ncbi:ATP-dependent sacrificial sulfur transferase LarE [Sporolactobacillus shoreicorticis]|uniref:ATP-dependent sacrificial sulfur transferase LarE n=1 Tax=Sporolactobacillus shoreicorticis TaxID=1923877 RepID=A0ABW5S0Q7_9BACL|nr:ATP-dependent sacrificial sulfur transferase LarE [Sporolactobacillus shoreicorticis]MCO7124524.1 ATP-dependent sacrificial sulfur transferase LarE [Sporolactobacillus shoreicorticis]
MSTLTEKKQALVDQLKKMNRVVVAFSGGIDSTLVLKMALDTLGKDNVLAVVANSELFTNEEFDKAVSLAKDLGAVVKEAELSYLSEEHIKRNTPDSWYYAKKGFYARMNEIAAAEGFAFVLDGMIKDDESDFRPGLRARTEAGARSVLQEAGFYKTDVRALAKIIGLNNWNKVSSCSVSSRFPYGTTLTLEKIDQVMKAEKYIRELGFPVVRVRSHGEIARVEIPAERLNDLLEVNDKISQALTEFGFRYVTLDLSGFRSGRMNETLSAQERKAFVS